MNLRLKGTTALGLAACMLAAPAFADMEAAKAFLDSEIGELSTLSRADQEAEMQFFCRCGSPLHWYVDQCCVRDDWYAHIRVHRSGTCV